MFGDIKDRPDALAAVKLDPAVLEAQVTMHTKENSDANLIDTSRNSAVENKKDEETMPQSLVSFEDMMGQHEAALLALTPHQLELLMKYADMLRRQRIITQKYLSSHGKWELFGATYFVALGVTAPFALRTVADEFMAFLMHCAFCKNNGRPAFWYTSHVLKDGRGRVQCPVLRRYRCPRCGLSGDHAHTIKYCPNASFVDTQSSCSGNFY